MRESMRRWVAGAALATAALGFAGVAGATDPNVSGVAVPPVPRFEAKDAAKYGEALAHYMDQRDSGWKDLYTKARMVLIDSRGDKVERDVVFTLLEQSGGNKILVKFESPADIRGIAALIHEHHGAPDDTWLYLPASRRTRRISGANRTASFQGTEFTYEDLSRITVQNYSWKFLENATEGGAPVYKLEAHPTYGDTGYSKLVVYINRDQWRIEKVDYFDKAGRLLKTLTQSNWKLFHGRFWRAATNMMVNHQTHKTTEIDSAAMYLNLSLYKRRDGTARANLTEDQFSKHALESP